MTDIRTLVVILLASGIGFAAFERLSAGLTPHFYMDKTSGALSQILTGKTALIAMLVVIALVFYVSVRYFKTRSGRNGKSINGSHSYEYASVSSYSQSDSVEFRPFDYWKSIFQFRMLVLLAMMFVSMIIASAAASSASASNGNNTGASILNQQRINNNASNTSTTPMNIMLLLLCVNWILTKVLVVLQESFFATVADARMGATFMTVLRIMAVASERVPALLITLVLQYLQFSWCGNTSILSTNALNNNPIWLLSNTLNHNGNAYNAPVYTSLCKGLSPQVIAFKKLNCGPPSTTYASACPQVTMVIYALSMISVCLSFFLFRQGGKLKQGYMDYLDNHVEQVLTQYKDGTHVSQVEEDSTTSNNNHSSGHMNQRTIDNELAQKHKTL